MQTFEDALGDDARGVVTDFEAKSRVAVVAFGGIWTRMGGLPPFEFFGQLDGVAAARVFVRDLDQAWYQLGVRGVADDIAGSTRWLASTLKKNDVDRVVCVGCSAGGFAAIVFGSLLSATEVHAFNPQTTIERQDLRELADDRWDAYLKPMRKKLRRRAPIFDTRTVVPMAGGRPKIFLHFGTQEPRDERHALRLQGLPSVELVPHEGLGHNNLTRALRDSGQLRDFLTRAVA